MGVATSLGDIYALATALAWSFAVIFFRWAGQSLGTIPSKVLQNCIACLLFLCALLFLNEPLFPDLAFYQWILLSLSAVLGITLGDTLFIASLNRLGASSQAIIDGLYSPFLIIVGALFFAERLSMVELLGGSMVVAGVIVGTKGVTSQAHSSKKLMWGYIYGVLAQITLVLCVIVIKDLLETVNILLLSAYRFFIGTFALIAWTSLSQRHTQIWSGFKLNKGLLINIAGSFLGPFLATIFWFLGFKYSPLGRAAIYNQLASVFIIILAIVLLKEKLSRNKIWAITLSLTGAFIAGSKTVLF